MVKGRSRSIENLASDIRYFSKTQEQIGGPREQSFAVALEQTVSRAKWDGAAILSQTILRRILRNGEIEGVKQGAYYALVNSLTSICLKGDDVETLELALKQARDRLDSSVVDEIAEMFGL